MEKHCYWLNRPSFLVKFLLFPKHYLDNIIVPEVLGNTVLETVAALCLYNVYIAHGLVREGSYPLGQSKSVQVDLFF